MNFQTRAYGAGVHDSLRIAALASVAAAAYILYVATVQVVVILQNSAIPFSVRVPDQSVDSSLDITGPAHVVSVGTSVLDLVLGQVSGILQFWLILAALIPALCLIAALLSVALLAWKVGAGQAFGATATRSLSVAAWSVLAAGILGQTLKLFAARAVVANVFGFGKSTGVEPAASLDLTLIFVGLALVVVTVAFAVGRQLKRDTDGLV